MQITPVTETFASSLSARGIQPGSAPWNGVLRAVGVGPGEVLTSAANPIYGFYVQSFDADPAAPLLVLYLVTGGRFLRYEWSPAGEVTSTFGLDRVASVEDLLTGDTATVSVFLDSSVRVLAGQGRGRTTPDPDSADDDTVTTGEWSAREEGVVYRLTATGDPANPAPVVELHNFSRALRLLLGA